MAEEQYIDPEFMDFLTRYFCLLTEQLEEVKSNMDNLIDSVMESVNKLSEETEESKQTIDKALDNTYIQPDHEIEQLVESVQQSVDDILENATLEDPNPVEAEEPKVSTEIIIENRRKRLNAKFHKHINGYESVDEKVKELLFGMIGALSNDDVISQRLEHTQQCLQYTSTVFSSHMQKMLSPAPEQDLQSVKNELTEFAKKKYSLTEEKQLMRKLKFIA